MKKWLLIGLLIPLAAAAQESTTTNCTRDSQVRIIEVVYPQAADLPCEVHYTKGGKTETLWMASNESGYCENKAAEFVARQQGWGWSCESGQTADE